MNKFNAVVWDGFQVKNNEFQLLIFIFISWFWHGAIWETLVVIACSGRAEEAQYPQLQFTWKQGSRRPQNAFCPMPTLKAMLWKELFLPLEEAESKLSSLLRVYFGNGLTTGPWVQTFLWKEEAREKYWSLGLFFMGVVCVVFVC